MFWRKNWDSSWESIRNSAEKRIERFASLNVFCNLIHPFLQILERPSWRDIKDLCKKMQKMAPSWPPKKIHELWVCSNRCVLVFLCKVNSIYICKYKFTSAFIRTCGHRYSRKTVVHGRFQLKLQQAAHHAYWLSMINNSAITVYRQVLFTTLHSRVE